MPEALAVVAVFVVTVIAWVGAWLNARNPAGYPARDEIARLQHHAAWLEQRLVVAQRECWGGEMIAAISAELAATAGELERTIGRK
jgi:hypothetical protein